MRRFASSKAAETIRSNQIGCCTTAWWTKENGQSRLDAQQRVSRSTSDTENTRTAARPPRLSASSPTHTAHTSHPNESANPGNFSTNQITNQMRARSLEKSKRLSSTNSQMRILLRFCCIACLSRKLNYTPLTGLQFGSESSKESRSECTRSCSMASKH